MLSTLLLCFTGAVVLFIFTQIQSLRRNISEAKSAGFRYVIVPCHLLNIPWALSQPLLLPFLNRLPKAWTEKWLPLLQFTRGWHFGYEPFRAIGADTFMAVSAGGKILYTCDATASAHLLRSAGFGKPAELMGILNVFGPTMTGTDGPETRLFRKVSAPFFNEQTLHQVWSESFSGAEALIKVLKGRQEVLRPVMARLSLHLLNTLCFEREPDFLNEMLFLEGIPQGHELSYSNAMHNMLDHFATIFLTPSSILKNSPLKSHKDAYQAYTELRKYMEELRDSKKNFLQEKSKKSAEKPSLLELLVMAGEAADRNSQPLLSSRAVLGNIFIFMFAGHEANANTLTFIMYLLACFPAVLKALQGDIDRILGPKDSPREFSYEKHYNLLMESHVGAVINEALRLFTVLPFIPKSVTDTPQPLNVGDHTHIVPANTLILINTSAAHRHPKNWPNQAKDDDTGRRSNLAPHPVADFNPSRWLGEDKDTTDFLKPTPGSFVPFSDGSRGCLGRRFALVELCAVVTRVFSEWSVELAVPLPMDEENKTAKQKLWKDTRNKAEYELSAGVDFDMSLRLTGKIPVDFVRRGEEKFFDF